MAKKEGSVVIEKLVVSIEADIGKLLAETKTGVKTVEKELRTVHKAVTASEREFKLLKKTIGEIAAKSKTSFKEAGAALKKAFDAKGVKLNLEHVSRAVGELEKEGKKGFLGMGAGALGFAAKFAFITTGIQMGIQAITKAFAAAAKAATKFFTDIIKGGMQANIMFEDYTTQFTTLLGSADAAYERIQDLTIFAVKTPFELPGIVEASRVLQVFGGDFLATGDNLTMVGDIAAGVGREFSSVALWVGRMYDAMMSGRPFGIAASRLQVMGAMTGKARNELEQLQKEGASGEALWTRFNELVGDRWAGNMDRLSRTLTGLISNIKDFITNLLRVSGLELFEEIRESAAQLLAILEEKRPELEAIGKAFFEIAANVADFVATELLDQLQNLDTEGILKIAEALWEAAENSRTLLEIILLLAEGVKPVEALTWAFETLNDAIAMALNLTRDYAVATAQDVDVVERLTEILAAHDRRIKEHNTVKEEAVRITKKRTAALGDETDALKEVTDAEKDAVMGYAESIMDLQDDLAKRQAKLDRSHFKKMGEIIADIAAAKIKATADADKDLVKLEQETNRKREEETRDYHIEEQRAEQDHQDEMRRLRIQYMMDMADAVKARDARAIVDIRRNFKIESQERIEDEEKRKTRDREDHERGLQELADNERRRQEEIKQSLAEQLRDLEQAQTKALANERASYAERQADLNRALTDKLQAIAKELADEDSINAEGARRILATLQKTFGIGGSIDALMEAFTARRRQRMIVRVTFEPESIVSPVSYAGGAPPGYKQGGMGGPAWAGSFQHGGSVVARSPTIAQFGEVPEIATFTPLSDLPGGVGGGSETLNINLQLSGSAPPGIRTADRDQIAAVLLAAIRESGAMEGQG